MAGSIERAGLKEPPDVGPIVTAATKMKPPIARGAMTPFHGAESSVATVMITETKRKTATSSASIARQSGTPTPGIRDERVLDVVRVDEHCDEDGDEAADQLRDPVGDHRGRRELAGGGQPERDRGVEVPTRDLPEGGDHQAETEAEARCHPRRRDRAGQVHGRGDAAEPDEEEPEGADDLCQQPVAHRWCVHVVPPALVVEFRPMVEHAPDVMCCRCTATVAP